MHPPTSQDTLDDLRRIRELARSRGDDIMALLLSGLDLYARVGREFELLDTMREFAREIAPAVENTPTAAQLKELYERGGAGETRD